MESDVVTAHDYNPALTRRLLGATAEVLRSFADPNILRHVAIVGGLVPTLLTDGYALPESGPHVGTSDLDLMVSVDLLRGGTADYYGSIITGLEDLGLSPEEADDGTKRTWRWLGRVGSILVTVAPHWRATRGRRPRPDRRRQRCGGRQPRRGCTTRHARDPRR